MTPGDSEASVTDWRAGANYYFTPNVGLGAQYKHYQYSYDRGILVSELGGEITYEGFRAFLSFLFCPGLGLHLRASSRSSPESSIVDGVKPGQRKRASRLPRAVAVLVAIAVVAALGSWWSASRHDDTTAPSTAATSAPPVAGAEAPAAFQKLEGRWVRVDGGHVLEIRSVEAGGRVDASYLDPRAIHVAKALASEDGRVVKLVIELRDADDPGSTYRLRYDAGRDVLEGTYSEARERQMYDVSFMRR